MSETSKVEYKDTLNLPKTDFKMRADAANKELETQKFWEENNIYKKNLAQRNKNNKFILHDGPPYLSSDKIHIGTALNKILKDIVVKYKSQRGFYSPYVPGYDGHGLPIENAVVKTIKGGRSAVSPFELRQKCREFALKNLKGQESDFKRLGVWGNWENPYITIDGKFEAEQARVFGDMAEKNYIYKGLKPVYWCASCETALAEAEVEYADHTSKSIYVKFKIIGEEAKKVYQKANIEASSPLFAVIWTTTPWTIPANLAISVHPRFDYVLAEIDGAVYIVADELLERFLNGIERQDAKVKKLASIKGQDLELIKAKHPLFDRDSIIIVGEHVTLDAGTGCVHTAPGHGLEDYEVGQRYKIGVLSPLDNRGIFTSEAGQFEGLSYKEGNNAVIEALEKENALLKCSEISHSYPHCWRCKNPVIYRATSQWFVDVEAFRDKALESIKNVEWIPESGENRIYNMVESRSDWCISRQRAWGVPIPVFYCEDCEEAIIEKQVIENVAQIFERESSDAWVKYEAKELLPEGFKCPKCSSTNLRKENDIMDVWFDSGVTHRAVVDARSEELGHTPVELYLEGSDQHRGWFQSSLLTSVATKGRAPYKSVLTHGFVLDGDGRKMSKSLGNVIEPQKIVNQYGADVLRFWCASVDYRNDVKIGQNIVQQLVEVYKKVRNTSRFLLGNLYDFDPKTDYVEYKDLEEIDKYALHKLQVFIEKLTDAFDKYEFYRYYQLLQNFAAVDLSSFYLDIVKDRLYTSGKKSLSRKACQTVLYEALSVIVRTLVPVTPHLAEDIWQYIEECQKDKESVLLTDWPVVKEQFVNQEINDRWEKILSVRDLVTRAIETVRVEKIVGSSLETAVYITAPEEIKAILKQNENDLSNLFITSQAFITEEKPEEILSVLEEGEYKIYVTRALGEKCERCWKYRELGTDSEHPTICSDCAEAVE